MIFISTTMPRECLRVHKPITQICQGEMKQYFKDLSCNMEAAPLCQSYFNKDCLELVVKNKNADAPVASYCRGCPNDIKIKVWYSRNNRWPGKLKVLLRRCTEGIHLISDSLQNTSNRLIYENTKVASTCYGANRLATNRNRHMHFDPATSAIRLAINIITDFEVFSCNLLACSQFWTQ